MPYTPGFEGDLPSVQSENCMSFALNGRSTALPAGTAFDASGNVMGVVPSATNFLGVTLMPIEASNVPTIETLVYSDIATGNAGAAIARGQALMVAIGGTLVPATAGNSIVGIALSSTSAAGSKVQFLIARSGRQ